GRRPFWNLAGLGRVEKQTGCRGQAGAFVRQVTAELIVSAEWAVGVGEIREHYVAGVGGRQLCAIYVSVVVMHRQIVIPIYEAIMKGVVPGHPGVGAELVEVSRAAFPEVVVKAEVEVANKFESDSFKGFVRKSTEGAGVPEGWISKIPEFAVQS